MTESQAPALDSRRHPYRPDVAAEHLRGRVEARRFVRGRPMRCVRPLVAIKGRPARAASQTAELLYGETFTVYESRAGWAWGQRATDGYVGHVRASALGAPGADEPDHVVCAMLAPVLDRAHFKAPALRRMSINSPLRIESADGEFLRLAGGGWVHEQHVAAVNAPAPDFVAVAESFLGLPYVWGGNSGLGVDCSGLLQAALQRAGRPCPRDTDMQERELGRALAARDPARLKRGDIVFFPGHVGIVRAPGRLLHSSSRWMRVLDEPLDAVLARLRAEHARPVTAVRRVA